METLAASPIPTIVAGVAAVSPAVLAVLGRRRRRRRRKKRGSEDKLDAVDIPDQWLSYLLGTRYGNTPSTTARSAGIPILAEPEDDDIGKWAKYGSTAVKLSPDWRNGPKIRQNGDGKPK